MKPNYLLLSIAVFSILFSCKKTSLEELSLEHLAGDYHFIYGQNSEFDITSNQEISTQYGIRIKEKEVLFFENGNEVAKAHLRHGCSLYDYSCINDYKILQYLELKYKKRIFHINFSGDTITSLVNPDLETQPFEKCVFLKN